FMILGQSATTAALLSLDQNLAVQDLPYETLRKRLITDGQVLELNSPRNKTAAKSIKLNGIVVDDAKAELEGNWTASTANFPFVGYGYSHDGNTGKGSRHARFKTRLKPGRYVVNLAYPPNSNRASNVPVTIHHSKGDTTVIINQRLSPKNGKTTPLGTYEFKEIAAVTITNKDTNGYVIIDAAQFLPTKE
ncbi:uncharacterized protein METZ01_LOCUS371180, partial [marine metagenome]